MGFFSFLFIVLLVLKLTGLAMIPWLVVFAPLIVDAVAFVAFLVFAATMRPRR